MLKCSHITFKVNNIADVIRDYQALGFSIEWGSAPERANNALLWFEQGPFIEFFQIPRPFAYLSFPLGLIYGNAAGERWRAWSKAGEGWCDVALEPDHIHDQEMPDAAENRRILRRIKSAVNNAGISTSRIIKGRRIRPDGMKVRYSLFAPVPSGLPFIVSNYDPPQRPEKIEHPNGASGVEWVKMGVSKDLLHQFSALTAGDPWLRMEPSAKTSVMEIGLYGLKKRLEAKLLHGAVFSAVDK
jgi:hypothetical protein